MGLLEAVAPEKPVSEIRNGWMEKKGNMATGWKLRFFVLLSTHELLYFESDRSPKCKGVRRTFHPFDILYLSSLCYESMAQCSAIFQIR